MIFGYSGNFRKKNFFKVFQSLHTVINSFPDSDLFISSDFQLSNFSSGVQILRDKILSFEELNKKCDVIISSGGDGTILSTVRRQGSLLKPILGIHIGSFGFLAQSTESDMEEKINKIINREYIIEKRMMLEVSISSNQQRIKYNALNDVIIDQGESIRLLKCKVQVNGIYLNTYTSDGLIFASPTGSTAYSLSSGGPIISPDMKAIILTPICPQSLSARPIIFSDNSAISIEFESDSGGMILAVDGQVRIQIKKTDVINIQKSKNKANIIQFNDSDYFSTLRNKMNWLGNVK
ncbi:MAG: hypothetical protein CBD58_00020 [bacterium TMED198]|nr:MAG: hypothetical protein CBD58_00020 [bacterium TMED198]